MQRPHIGFALHGIRAVPGGKAKEETPPFIREWTRRNTTSVGKCRHACHWQRVEMRGGKRIDFYNLLIEITWPLMQKLLILGY